MVKKIKKIKKVKKVIKRGPQGGKYYEKGKKKIYVKANTKRKTLKPKTTTKPSTKYNYKKDALEVRFLTKDLKAVQSFKTRNFDVRKAFYTKVLHGDGENGLSPAYLDVQAKSVQYLMSRLKKSVKKSDLSAVQVINRYNYDNNTSGRQYITYYFDDGDFSRYLYIM